MATKERPWNDARTCTRPRGNGKSGITLEMIQKAIDELNSYVPPRRYHFFIDNLPHIVPNEDIIEYYKGSGVVVVDRKGNRWLN